MTVGTDEQEFYADVEKDDNGSPIIIAYGYKKVQIEGKTYLAAMDRQEYVDFCKEIDMEPQFIEPRLESNAPFSSPIHENQSVLLCFRGHTCIPNRRYCSQCTTRYWGSQMICSCVRR